MSYRFCCHFTRRMNAIFGAVRLNLLFCRPEQTWTPQKAKTSCLQKTERICSRITAKITQDRQAVLTATATAQAVLATAQAAVLTACNLVRSRGRSEDAAKCSLLLDRLDQLSATISLQTSYSCGHNRPQHAEARAADRKPTEFATTRERGICDYSFVGRSSRAASASQRLFGDTKQEGKYQCYNRDLIALWFQIGLLSALPSNTP